MPEYLAPGVYVEEISRGPKPIEGVSTSTVGFAGATERGPEFVKFIGSWIEFQRWFGGYDYNRTYLPHAVQGFFNNGGKRCFVGRIVGSGATLNVGAVGTLSLAAIGRGAWGNNILVKVRPASQAVNGNRPDWFRITIMYYRNMPDPLIDPTDPAQLTNPDRRDPDVLEDYDDLTHQPLINNAEKVINGGSKLVRAWWTTGETPAPITDPTDLTPLGAAGSDGDDIVAGDFQGQAGSLSQVVPEDRLGRDSGLLGIRNVDEVAIIAVPDSVRYGNDVTNMVIDQCEELKDRFAIVSVDDNARTAEVSSLRPPRDSQYAAFYYPWIWVYDPTADRRRLLPPTGHIAGIFARSDIDYGVHKAPANEVVRGALDLELPVTKAMQDVLNPKGVNCIRDFRSDGRGLRLWGARTMSSDPEWRYVNVRRLFLYVEESIDEATQWVVFEPNHEPTWARVARSISAFLVRVWKSGALQGLTQDEAFFVKCDRTTMTEDDINNGRLICYIGIAPVKPAEFVIFRISQKTLEAQS